MARLLTGLSFEGLIYESDWTFLIALVAFQAQVNVLLARVRSFGSSVLWS
jgi:hypothetical protein